LLNYEYADLYRQTKIQDSVYEFLTQQYELARIREAKELPTVRVMDRAALPERKSGPFRSLIVILSTLFGVAFALCWLMGKNAWQQIPADDPRRMVAEDALRVLKRRLRRPSTT
jgi:LPS O-antigen subunit length determinant protein (WzzB/FepE family)